MTLGDSSIPGKVNSMQIICQLYIAIGNGCLDFQVEKANLELIGKGAEVDG